MNELVILGILAGINVSYINVADTDPAKWVITDVYNVNTLGIPSDPIYEGRHLIVLFHSIYFFGACCNNYDAIYVFSSIKIIVNAFGLGQTRLASSCRLNAFSL